MIKKIIHVNPGLLFESLCLTFLNSFPDIINIIILQKILISLETCSDFSIVSLYIILYGAITIISSAIVFYLSTVLIPKRQQLLIADLKTEVFNIMLNEKLICFDDPDFFNMMSLAFQVTEVQSISTISSAASLFTHLVSIFTLTAIIANIEPWLILMAMLASIVSFYYGMKQSVVRAQIVENTMESTRESYYYEKLFQKKKSIKELKIYGSDAKKMIIERYLKCIKQIITVFTHKGEKIFSLETKNVILYVTNLMIILFVLSWKVVENGLMIGSVVAAISGTQQMTDVLSSFARTFSDIKHDGILIGKYRNFIDSHTYMKESLETYDREKHYTKVDIDIFDLGFRFSNEDEDTLKNISLSISNGEKVAFVGPNGSGKSVLTKIIAGLYTPTKGKILLNGKNYEELAKDEVQCNISIVYQDFVIFSISIAENILMRPFDGSDKSRRIVEDALSFAGLMDKVKKLPEGIDTRITREFSGHGVVLSGGEMQRIAIARAYAHKRPVFIFDEPNSSIDAIAETELTERVNLFLKDSTVIYVTHRPQCLKNINKIFVIDHGIVVETGTYDSLLDKKGLFYSMFNYMSIEVDDKENKK